MNAYGLHQPPTFLTPEQEQLAAELQDEQGAPPMTIYRHTDSTGDSLVVETASVGGTIIGVASDDASKPSRFAYLDPTAIGELIDALRPYAPQPTAPEPAAEWERELADDEPDPEPEPFEPSWDPAVYALDREQTARIGALKAAREVLATRNVFGSGSAGPYDAITVARYIESGSNPIDDEPGGDA